MCIRDSVCEICHLPSDYANGLVVTEMKLSDKGNELVTFRAAKNVDDSSDSFRFATPNRLTDVPKEEGVTSPPLKEIQVALIRDLIDEAAAYVRGDRAQGQIQFPSGEPDEDDEVEPSDGNTLQFNTSAANANTDTGTPVKPRRRKAAGTE